MQSENFRHMLEELKATKTKVRIYLVHGTSRDGYIIEIREDCLCLEDKKGSEKISNIIPFSAVSVVDVNHEAEGSSHLYT